MSKIEQFEVMQETIRVLQEHRNNALDKLVGLETNNRFLAKRLSELVAREETNQRELSEAKRLLSKTENNNAVNNSDDKNNYEIAEQNKKFSEKVTELNTANEQLELQNRQLKRKLMSLRTTTVGKQ